MWALCSASVDTSGFDAGASAVDAAGAMVVGVVGALAVDVAGASAYPHQHPQLLYHWWTLARLAVPAPTTLTVMCTWCLAGICHF